MNKKHFIIILILLVAAFLRFYNLMFDYPYFFNPDEKNMAYAITQLRLPNNLFQLPSCFMVPSIIHDPRSTICNLNPHFFAYGQFPLYLAYGSGIIGNFITHKVPFYEVNIEQAIFWLRFWSALSSTLTVLLVFLITKHLYDKVRPCQSVIPFLSAFFAAFTPSLIQSAHFGTTESLLTFFFILVIYLSILYAQKKLLTSHFLLLTSLILGLALSTKVSALVFFTIPFLAILLVQLKFYKKFLLVLFIILCSLLIFIISSPFTLLDFNGLRGSMNYESAVALGTTKVFYTRQFENTVPVLFQAQKIFPFALGWPLFIFGSFGFLIMLISNFKYLISKKTPNTEYQNTDTIIIFSFLIYFLPNAFLFAKWTRFMTPILPLFCIFTGYFLYQMYLFVKKISAQTQISNVKCQNSNVKRKTFFSFKILVLVLSFALCVLSLLPGLLFFTVYTRPDTRIQASEWIYQNIPSNSYILSETANVVDIPIKSQKSKVKSQKYFEVISFNFYDLDNNPFLYKELLNHLEKADYIFVPSRRIFANVMRLPDKYPLTNKYYELLFSGKLGFEKVAEFSSFPLSSIIYNPRSSDSDPRSTIHDLSFFISDEQSEETFSVFDHPVVRIYKKQILYNQKKYADLFSR